MLNFIDKLINKRKQTKQRKKLAANLYQEITKASRNKFFYIEAKCKDDINQRFELLVLHMSLAQIQMKDNQQQKIIAQYIFDIFLADMDNNLREIGIGDLTVPKKMKHICNVFYQRLLQYEKLLLDKNVKITDTQQKIRLIFEECDTIILCEYLKETKKLLLKTKNKHKNGYFSFFEFAIADQSVKTGGK